jgi:thiamine pyrophosphate-dependent acetolactate synthase large subunit-like protein
MSDHRRGPRRDRRGAQAEVEELAERTGALLATTLPARGMFDHNPFSIGIAGGYAREIAREIGAQADLVVVIGASLNYYTVDGGHMFPKAEVAQIERSQRTAFLYRDLDLSRSVSTCWQPRTNWRV